MRHTIETDQAPRAIGPYSQAVRAAGFIFTSGQIPLDPGTGKIVAGGIGNQARQSMENIRAILTAAGSDFSQVIKATIFLADIKDFAAINEVYSGYFPADPPARSAFQVAALPMGALVEIEMIALAPTN
ncbi:MAG: RidA family protein [Desulfatiglandaceae bacterium]